MGLRVLKSLLAAALMWSPLAWATTPASQRVMVTDPTGANITSVSAANALKVDGSAVNQPVTQATSPWVTSRTWTLSNGTDSIAAVQSGVWTVQPGNTQNTTPWLTQDSSDGPVNAGTAAGKSSLAGAVYNSSPLTLTNTQQASLQSDVNGYLRVSNTGTTFPIYNGQDVSTTTAASGNSGTLDSHGMASISATANITAASGTTPTLALHLQVSDDGSDWIGETDLPRISAATILYFNATRLTRRYYRYAWDITGTSPSFTFTVTTTLKPVQTHRAAMQFKYADIDLSVNGNASSVFRADGCQNMNVVLIRAAGGANATVQIFGSNDSANWIQVFGNVAVNPATTNGTFLQAQAWRYYEAEVTSHAGVGTSADIQWSCN